MFSGLKLLRLTENDLIRIVEGEKALQQETSRVIDKDSGPGEHSIWRTMDRLSSWIERESYAQSRAKKKIIISDAVIGILPPRYEDIVFFDMLLDHYDVYFWQGDEQPFIDSIRIRSSVEFWDKRSLLTPANAEAVLNVLAIQGLPLEDFIVVDTTKYQMWTSQYQAIYLREEYPDENDYQKHVSNSDERLDILRIEPGKLTTKDRDEFTRVIKSSSHGLAIEHKEKNSDVKLIEALKKKVTFTTTRSPAVQSQDKNAVYDRFLEVNQYCYVIMNFTCKSLRLNLDESMLQVLTIANCNIEHMRIWDARVDQIFIGDFDLKTLIIDNVQCKLGINLPSGVSNLRITSSNFKFTFPSDGFPNLESLTLLNNNIKAINTRGHITTLKHFITDDPAIKYINYPNLEELQIEIGGENADFSNLAQLRKLKINGQLRRLDLKNHPQLEELQLEVDFNVIENVSMLKNIRSLKIRNVIVERLYDLAPNLEQLEVTNDKGAVGISVGNVQKVDLDKFTRLTHLKLMSECLDSASIGGKNSTLRHLEIDFAISVVVDVSQLPKLETLIIKAKDVSIVGSNKQLKILFIETGTDFALNDFPALSKFTFRAKNTIDTLDISKLSLGCHFDAPPSEMIVNYIYDRAIHLLSLNQPNRSYFHKLSLLPGEEGSKGGFDGRNIIIEAIDDNKNINTLDLSRFKNLLFLTINSQYNLEEIIFPPNCQLRVLHMSLCGIETLDFSQLPKLEELKIKSCNLNNIDLSSCRNLKSVDFVSNLGHEATVWLVASSPELRELKFSHTGTGHVHVEGCAKLQNLFLRNFENVYVVTKGDIPLSSITLRDIANLFTDNDAIKSTLNNQLRGMSRTHPKNPSAELQSITAANDQSSVSLFNIRSSTGIDSDTGAMGIFDSSNNNYRLSFYSDNKVSKDEYRINIFDNVEYQNKKIEFRITDDWQAVSVTHPRLLDEALKEEFVVSAFNQEVEGGLLEGNIVKGVYIPLGSRCPLGKGDLEVHSSPIDAVDLFWSEARQQFAVKVKPNIISSNINVIYRYKKTNINVSQSVISQTQAELLPADLKQEIEARLNYPQSPLAFIFDSNIALDLKIRSLIAYLKSGNQAPLGKQLNDDVDIICQVLIENKGVCRHRAKAFMLILQMLQVHALLNMNEQHAIGIIPYINKGGTVLAGVDLGGGESYDRTLIDSRKDAFASVVVPIKPINKVPVEPVDKKDPVETVTRPTAKQLAYEELFKSIVDERLINTPSELVAANHYNPLIILKSGQTSFQVNRALSDYFNAQSKSQKYIYIHRPQDLEAFLNPIYFNNGDYEFLPDSQLRRMMQQGGVLVVNWANFDVEQIGGYTTLLDKMATLDGEDISPDLRIIGIAHDNTEGCEAFKSRCQRCVLSPRFFVKVIDEKQENESVQVDLYNSASWRELLLGKEFHLGQQIMLELGPLIEAIKEDKTIIIYNPPPDASFDLLMHRVMHERKVLYNGSILKVGDGFNVEIKQKANADLAANVRVIDSEPLKVSTPIYLGIHNIHECYELSSVMNHRQEKRPGLLSLYNINENVFYITSFIPSNEWQRLLAFITTKFPEKQFTFVLAPGSAIENVAARKYTPSVLNEAPVIFTNDPDFSSGKLAKSSVVIDVLPDMNFSDLIYEQHKSKPNVAGNITYTYIEKDALTLLRQGENVVLTGEISPSLYLQLLPYMYRGTVKHINGEVLEIKGSLKIVLASTQKDQANVLDYCVQEYAFDNYTNYFNQQDRELLQKIQSFYDFVRRFPHEGLGRPPLPELNYQRIKQMIVAIKDPLHGNNPLKDVFNYDYPRHSEDYAYYNVIAKCIFESKPQFNAKKFHELLSLYKIDDLDHLREHAWKVLNSLDANLLQQILADGFDFSSRYPALSEKAFHKLHRYIYAIARNKFIPINKDTKKQAKHLTKLLADDTTLLIILKGPPGVGKSYSSKHLLNNCFRGEDDIEKFLEHGGVIAFDEPNMHKPGVFNFLKGFFRDRQICYYKGRIRRLKPGVKYKVVAACNTEDHPGRYYHQIFQEYGRTIYFDKPSDRFLLDILAKILKPYGLFDPEICNVIIKTYHLIKEFNFFHPTSIRDLENLALRFCFMKQAEPKRDNMELLLRSCVSEFAYTIESIEKRTQFIDELYKLAGSKKQDEYEGVICVDENHVIPKSKVDIYTAINTKLTMIAALRAGATFPASFKRLIILEGESGVGKSSLFIAMLLHRAKMDKTNGILTNDWEYIVINGSTRNVRAKMIEAFYLGKKLIFNEINLKDDKSNEKLLNQLLDGNDESVKPEEKRVFSYLTPVQIETNKKSFLVLASENPGGKYAGRTGLSPAIRNRAEFYHYELTDQDLLTLSNADFVRAYKKTCSSYSNINFRHFFIAQSITPDFARHSPKKP